MRKLILGLALASAVLALGATPASAQTQITLGGISTGSITFTGDGAGNLSMTLGSCTLGATCITGSASGIGGLASSGFYKITGGPVALTLTSTGPNTWSASGSLTFDYGTAPGGTDLLSGTLDLVNLTQVASTGVFNTTLVANLTGLSGSLMSVFTSAGGIAQVTVTFSSGTDLTTLASGAAVSATTFSGTIVPTPEPGSMVLLGSGLLALGTGLRRRVWRS